MSNFENTSWGASSPSGATDQSNNNSGNVKTEDLSAVEEDGMDWQKEYAAITQKLQSEEKKMRDKRRSSANRSQSFKGSSQHDRTPTDKDIDWSAFPKEFLEKEIQRYKESLDNEKANSKQLTEEKDRLEEENIETKLLLEDAKRQCESLKSEKENLETYVNQLADDMEKETSQLTSMKQQLVQESSSLSSDSSLLSSVSLGSPNPQNSISPNVGSTKSKKAHTCVELTIKEEELRTVREELKKSKESLKKAKQSVKIEKQANEGKIVMFEVDIKRAKESLKSRDEKIIKLENELKTEKLESVKNKKDVSIKESQLKAQEQQILEAQSKQNEQTLLFEQKGSLEKEKVKKETEEEKRKEAERLKEQKNQQDKEIDEFKSRMETAVERSREEIDNLKQELFYSLAMAIKLNLSMTGKATKTLPIRTLYDKVLENKIERGKWNEFIHKQLEGTK